MKLPLVFVAGYLLGSFTRVIASYFIYQRREREEMREMLREIERSERR